MPAFCERRGSKWVATDGEQDFGEHDSEIACQRQAAAINANTEEGVKARSLEISKTSPGGYVATLEDRGFPQLCRDRDRLIYHYNRLVGIRESRPTETVGEGWGLLDLVRVLEFVDGRIQATEADFFDVLLAELADPDDMSDPGPKREGVFVEREGGIHPHNLTAEGTTEIGGRHSHAFLIDGVIHFTEHDGAHSHDVGEGDEVAPEEGHSHAAFLPDGTEITFEDATPHSHERLVDTTALDGLHQHTATLEDGTEITTLSPAEFRELFGSAAEARAAEAVGRLVRDMPHIHVTERACEGEWEVVVIEAGISKNKNYWPRDLLEERGSEVFTNVPLEVLKFDAVNHGHAPHNPHDLPAGVVANSAGILTDVRFVDEGGMQPTREQAEAIAKVLGWSVEKVMEQSSGSIVATARIDESETGKDIDAKLSFAEENGLLEQYLGLSVDIAEAKPVRVNARRPDGSVETIHVRPEINESRGVLVDFVSRPSAGGKVKGKAA